ncbi:hypothetical protein WAK64_19940 [Bacillus spongiae]|uniref:DUF2642 domain-containing protein n=1 Tax=Bacillus spongiae TaxID=2683610 RepID=A0ABU8HJQ4_9BACI
MSSPKDSFHSFLETLKGKVVNIELGSSEINSGLLLDAPSDYIVVSTNVDQLIYINTNHVKRIIEKTDVKISPEQEEEAEPEWSIYSDFSELVQSFQNKYTYINNDTKSGLILGYVENYLIVSNETNGIVYYNIAHIHTIYEDLVKQVEESNAEITEFEQVDKVEQLLCSLFQKEVTIDLGETDIIEGTLIDCSEDHYKIVRNEEVHLINPLYIHSICERIIDLPQEEDLEEVEETQPINEEEIDETEYDLFDDSVDPNEEEFIEVEEEYRRGYRVRTNIRRRWKEKEKHSKETVDKTIDYFWNP